MTQVEVQNMPGAIEFPYQTLLLNSRSYSSEMLYGLLDTIYSSHPPFTGYIRFSGNDNTLLLLLFLNGTPLGAGQCGGSKPAFFSLHDLGRKLINPASAPLSATLHETDPALLKGIQLFLQQEPIIKAPTAFLDVESAVRHIGEAKFDAMITLSRDNTINFFFFRGGKGAAVYYADQSVDRPEGMTLDEEMMLYAFQPDATVHAYIFHDMTTAGPEDVTQIDKKSLYRLLTEGYLEKRRHNRSTEASSPPAENAAAISQPLPPDRGRHTIVLSAESGPLRGRRFTVVLPCSIGRIDCDVILDDRLVSRRHAEIKMVNDLMMIEDLTSTNGTMVNKSNITTSPLMVNDVIKIGLAEFRVSGCEIAQEGAKVF